MKKTIVASILGIAASAAMVATSNAQGFVYFQNYGFGASGQINAFVTYAGQTVPGSGTATAQQPQFSADLLYSFGSNLGTTYSDLGVAVPFYGNTLGDSANLAGLFSDPTSPESIPGYTTGAIDFIVQAFNGSSYATSLIKGQSAVVTLTGLATAANGLPTGDMLSDNLAATSPLTGFVVTATPEPTTLALAGLGGLASLVALRRKQS